MRSPITALIASSVFAAFTLGATAHAADAWKTVAHTLPVSLEQAAQNATQTVPGQVLEISLDDDHGQALRYEAQVLTPSGDDVEVWVDPRTGQAHMHDNDGKAKHKDVERAEKAKIHIGEAIRTATSQIPGTAVKAELGNHWGQTVYQVDVLQANFQTMEVKVDASSGQVLQTKRD